jgi:integrase
MRKVPGVFERPPNSKVFWISYFDPAGTRRRERGGTFAAALELLAVRKIEIRKNEYVPPRQSRAWTFSRLAREAIGSKALRLTSSTVETDQYRLVRLVPLIGSVRFDNLTPQRIEAALAALKNEGLSPSTLNRYRSFISSVFTWAVKTERIGNNPCSRVGRFRENEFRIRWLKDDEEKKLRLELTEAEEWEFDLSLYTGMRRGEQWDARWSDVDLYRGQMIVRGKTRRRSVEVNPHALLALEKLRDVSGSEKFVVPDHNAAPEAKRDLRLWLERAVKRAGVENFHWHDLRHTFASRLVMAGAGIEVVQRLLGHANISQTMRYAHLSAEHLRKAAAKLKPAKPAKKAEVIDATR